MNDHRDPKVELSSNSITAICPHIRGSIFTLCLGERELRSIGIWGVQPDLAPLSPEICCRMMLSKACMCDPAWEERVNDWFDLHYLDTIMLIRNMDESECSRAVDLWIESRDGEALPALTWALCSDQRGEISQHGTRLIQEAVSISRDLLVNETSAQEA